MLLGVLIADLHSRMASGDSVFIMSMLVGNELFEYTFEQTIENYFTLKKYSKCN